jgi:hypothetical protein
MNTNLRLNRVLERQKRNMIRDAAVAVTISTGVVATLIAIRHALP